MLFRNSKLLKVIVVFIYFISINIPYLSAIDEEKIITDYFWQKVRTLSPKDRPKIALVLGGGGARGLAHIGVLKVLEEEKVPIDIVVGTSVGSLIGALYCSGIPVEKIEKMGEDVQWDKITNMGSITLLKLFLSEQLLSTKKMEDYLARTIGNKRFDEMDKTLACIATDINTGEMIVLREGSVAFAARASSTIPGVFAPVEYRHRYLVDGGISSNIPVDTAKLLGADIVIAVSVTSDISKSNISNVLMTLTQSIYIQGSVLNKERLKNADIVIQPNVGDISAIDLGRFEECIDAGIIAARKLIPQIKRFLIEKTDDDKLFN
ncbi:MAG: patatin-like phospholipase family protein [Elusimicrobia bacterium]|nr:patatin-like phospholipase family protein [Elusimicrobiota bacterium]